MLLIPVTAVVAGMVHSTRQSEILAQNRDFCLPHLHSTPPLGVFRRNIAIPFGKEKTRMVWLPDGEKISKIFLFVSTESTNVTDGQTDRQTLTHRQTPHDGKGRAAAKV